MRKLLTLHGVGFLGTRGPWQKPVKRILSPHFKCSSIWYSHYRWFGLLTAVFEPWVLIVGFTVVFFYFRTRHTGQFWLWTVAVLLAAVPIARLRRKLALASIRNQLRRPDLAPNIIAHSMGTYLLGKALAQELDVKQHDIEVKDALLAGCVLRADFPWTEIRWVNRLAYRRVRNEVGSRDFIPRIAHLARRLRLLPKEFGLAGNGGFNIGEFVHTIEKPIIRCPQCGNKRPKAPIHNVMCAGYRHNDALRIRHVAYFWMPWLWGIEFDEYQRWLKMCLLASQHFQANEGRKLRLVEEEMLYGSWEWAQNVTLEGYINRLIGAHRRGKERGNVAALVLNAVYLAVDDARLAFQRQLPGWKQRARLLDPRLAVLNAVHVILK